MKIRVGLECIINGSNCVISYIAKDTVTVLNMNTGKRLNININEFKKYLR